MHMCSRKTSEKTKRHETPASACASWMCASWTCASCRCVHKHRFCSRFSFLPPLPTDQRRTLFPPTSCHNQITLFSRLHKRPSRCGRCHHSSSCRERVFTAFVLQHSRCDIRATTFVLRHSCLPHSRLPHSRLPHSCLPHSPTRMQKPRPSLVT